MKYNVCIPTRAWERGVIKRLNALYCPWNWRWEELVGKKKRKSSAGGQQRIQLPKDALTRVDLGQAFAEYDSILENKDTFVVTPAILSAIDKSSSRCFFIGRRGTGKTAVTRYILGRDKQALQILPQSLSPMDFPFSEEQLHDPHQRNFRSLVEAFCRALLAEVLHAWVQSQHIQEGKLPEILQEEIDALRDLDFDLTVLQALESLAKPLCSNKEKKWLRQMGHAKKIAAAMTDLAKDRSLHFTLLVDQIDEAWDGSDNAVRMLMALMHACTEVRSYCSCVRTLVFLRENVFDRVREIDPESSRFETCIASMDWTEELLLEMIQRRMNVPFVSRLGVKGETWTYFFENGEDHSSQKLVFDYCQRRPRDVLTYCTFAIESARSKMHQRVTIDDLLGARRRFSETRLKDLGDEYAENYPQISLVLSRFYGLGSHFILKGIEDFLKKLLVDNEVNTHCAKWIYSHSSPELFVRLLYNIGFIGLKNSAEDTTTFRSLGPSSTAPPPLTDQTTLIVHPSYMEALALSDKLIDGLDLEASWQKAGLVADLPAGFDLGNYAERLDGLEQRMKTLTTGIEHAWEWEECVGDMLRLCFYRWLTNLESLSRDLEGRVIRDWIASNTAQSGFWEMVRMKYAATQIIWECKNYADLKAADFQQVEYYMNDRVGRFAIIAFNGDEIKKSYYGHVKRVATDKKGLVLLLSKRDLLVFLRQARNGKISEAHIRTQFDKTERAIS